MISDYYEDTKLTAFIDLNAIKDFNVRVCAFECMCVTVCVCMLR